MSGDEFDSLADRFQLEDALMRQWQVADDLDLLAEQILEADLSADEIVNILTGLSGLHKLRCAKVDDLFGALVHTGKIH
jgi:hypothetical protein